MPKPNGSSERRIKTVTFQPTVEVWQHLDRVARSGAIRKSWVINQALSSALPNVLARIGFLPK